MRTTKYISESQVINGSIDHVDIDSNITEIICRGLTVTKLPNWENVKSVYCSNCINLVELPNWPNVCNVWCNNCPMLTQLPDWPNIDKIMCYNCVKLGKLGNWPNVRLVCCHDCPVLKQLPDWCTISILVCYNCPNLNEFPKWRTLRILHTSVKKIPYFPQLMYYNYYETVELYNPYQSVNDEEYISGRYHLKYTIDQYIQQNKKLDKSKHTVFNKDVLYE